MFFDLPEEERVKMCGRTKIIMLLGHNTTINETHLWVA